MGWFRALFCWPRIDLHEKALIAWNAYLSDPQDQSSLDRCIKYWRKVLKKTKQSDRLQRDQALECLATALLAKYNAGEKSHLRELEEVATLAPELYEETSPYSTKEVYDILVNLADAFLSESEKLGNGKADSHLLEISIDWYRKAGTLHVDPRTSMNGALHLCQALLCKDPPTQQDIRKVFSMLENARRCSSSAVDVDAHLDGIIELLVKAYNISDDIINLDRAIELLEEASTSDTASPPNIAEAWANHGRMLLVRALRTRDDHTSSGNDLREATESSTRAIRLGGIGVPRVLAHAQRTMALAASHRLSAPVDDITLYEVVAMIETLSHTLGYDGLSQSPETLVALASAIQYQRQQFDQEPPYSIVVRAGALCTNALETCKKDEASAIMFQSRFHFGGNKDDLEMAMRCFSRAAEDPVASKEEKERRGNQAKLLAEHLKALVEPDTLETTNRLSVPFMIPSMSVRSITSLVKVLEADASSKLAGEYQRV